MMFRLTWSWGDAGQPLKSATFEARNLRGAKTVATEFAEGRGRGFLVIFDVAGTRLASRRFHGETSNYWTTTPEGKALTPSARRPPQAR